MKKVVKAVLILIQALCITACSNRLDEKAYVSWVKDFDNGLHVKKELGEFVFDLQYLPVEYMWLQYRNGKQEDLQGMQYYSLTVSPKDKTLDFIEGNVSDEAEKQRRLYYFSYSFQSEIKVQENGKIIPCDLYHFERPVDLKNGRTFMLGFQNEFPESKEAKLVIDSEYFGSLPIKLNISKNNIPALAL